MVRFFQNRWWIVAASLCGMLVGSGPLHLFVFNIFMKPVSAELGLSRGTLSSAVGLYGLLNAGGSVAIGWMLDRWGTRRVMIPAMLAYVLVTTLFAFMSSGATVFLIFGFAGVISGCQSPVPYANVVAKWFDRERGLALGLSTAGVGLGVAVLGPIAAVLIGRFGWHGAYFGLAVLAFVVGFLPVAIFLRDPPMIARQPSAADAAAILPGLTLAEAARTGNYLDHRRRLHPCRHRHQRHDLAARALSHGQRHPTGDRDERALGGGPCDHRRPRHLGMVPRPFLGALCRRELLHHPHGRHPAPGAEPEPMDCWCWARRYAAWASAPRWT